jgi:photosystem II stability/assembly factor-like uncharacterized protein
MCRYFLTICLILLFKISDLYSQPWLDSVMDSNGKINFIEVQKAAEEYFNQIPNDTKGVGFKAYKRWEDNWKDRLLDDGTIPDAGITERNFLEYLRSIGRENRNVNNSNWTNLGPTTTTSGYNGLGRINCIAFHPSNINIIWVGSPGGGLWKTSDGGSSWSSTFDNNVVLGVSSIIIQPSNPNIMYIATGDGDASDTNSTGVLKSTDGGVTWQTTGLNWNVTQGRRIRKILMDPDDENMILAATSNGLYRTTNAGTSWSQLVTGNFFDVEANPDPTTNRFYAASNNKIYLSTNNGANWTEIITISTNNRIALGVSPANNSYVYALCSNSGDSSFNGLYKSTDSGNSYNLVSSTPNILNGSSSGSGTGGQGWYDLCISVDPTNAETLYTGGVNVWKSTNGGTTLTLRTHWSGASGVQTVHADHHCMEWQNNNTLWLGNDGGIYRTTNGGVNWTDRSNGLIISQMYRIDVSQLDTKVITGLQDNGTKVRNTSGSWGNNIGGDGMDCHISPTNANVMYGSYQYGNFSRSTNGSSFSTMTIADANTGAWITPLAIDPSNTQNVYVGYNRVHKSTNQGQAWTPISTSISASDLTFLFVAPSNGNILYAGTSSSLLRSEDAGINWTTKTSPGSGLQEIVIHPTNPDIIWAVRSNYTAGAKVYKSINGGTTWTNISGNLPNLPANCIIYQVGTNDGLYIGMDVGVYYRDNDLSNWEIYNTGLPNVRIRDLKIKYNTEEIFVGTYGRGAWKSPFREITSNCQAVSQVAISNLGINDASISWTPPSTPPSNGYQYAVTTTLAPPASGTPTTSTTSTFTGLNSNSTYYFHVRCSCDNGINSVWFTSGPHKTQTTCADLSTDTGGSSSNYTNLENTIRYVCPSGLYQQAVLTFSDFEVENTWDALYVFNGNSIGSPMIASNNPATQAGFPAGGYYGASIPGPFTSTHPSGCLTLQFLSNASVSGRGWEANTSCFCSTTVNNTNDDGLNSLRAAIHCATNGSSISFAPSINNSTIGLNSPIVIDKDLEITITNQNLTFQSLHAGHIFEVLPGKRLSLYNVKLIGGTGSTHTRAIINHGDVIATNLDVLDTLAPTGLGSTITNLGNIIVNGNYIIRSN